MGIEELSAKALEIVLATEFIAAISGTVLGGCIAAIIQKSASKQARVQNEQALAAAKQQRDEDDLKRRKTLAYGVLFKLIHIQGAYFGFLEHFRDMQALGEQDRVGRQEWERIAPLINYPATVKFETEEIAALLFFKESDIFNAVANSDNMFNDTIDLFKFYKQVHNELTAKLPITFTRDLVQVGDLTPEQMVRLEPEMKRINHFVRRLAERCVEGDRAATLTLVRFNTLLKTELGVDHKLAIQLSPETRAFVAAANKEASPS